MLELTYFKTLTSYIEIVDLAAICAVVGRIQVGTADPQWAIVDWSGSWARTVFTNDSLTTDVTQQSNSDKNYIDNSSPAIPHV
jgi:hypothetical protein